ncbi:hypothetical protein BKA61DRAFT_563102 [Leptodontidium sp. MPI-SDFR-AT-0119]|nr:hypothetical protein BKA61DRAFT_563102 [Leptodontidium sp. MPI-SDFR-AT-0119]
MESTLPPTRRVVTCHNSEGKACVAFDSQIASKSSDHGPALQSLWSSDEPTPDVNSKEDMGLAIKSLTNNGSIIRIVDLPPKSVGTLHRSISLDYIVVMKGEIFLTLDDGSKTLVKEHDLVVQQATMHGWDNETDNWARILCILVASKPPVVNGKALEYDVAFKV